MAASVVQSKKAFFSGAPSGSLTLDSNVTAGNTIVVLISDYGAVPSENFSCQDDHSNTYTLKVSRATQSGSIFTSIFYAYNVNTTGSYTVGVLDSSEAASISFTVAELTGVPTTDNSDGSNSNAGTGTAVDSGSLTPTVTGDVLIAVMSSYAGTTVTINPDADYTQLQEYENGATEVHHNVEVRIYDSTSPDTANWTIGSSLRWCGCIAAFKKSVPASTPSLAMSTINRKFGHLFAR